MLKVRTLPFMQEGTVVSPMDKTYLVTPDMLNFIQKNVLNVSEITRTTKLTEILDSYADHKSNEVFIIQNTRKKNSRGVFLDLEYFTELITIKQLVEESADLLVEQVALERKSRVASVGLEAAVNRLGLSEQDLLDIMHLAELNT